MARPCCVRRVFHPRPPDAVQEWSVSRRGPIHAGAPEVTHVKGPTKRAAAAVLMCVLFVSGGCASRQCRPCDMWCGVDNPSVRQSTASSPAPDASPHAAHSGETP